jgi:hypothetical protein
VFESTPHGIATSRLIVRHDIRREKNEIVERWGTWQDGTGERGEHMLTIHPEIVIDRKRKPRAVLLPYSEWNSIVADMEELEDIRAYDRAKARGGAAIPFEQAVKELRKRRSA